MGWTGTYTTESAETLVRKEIEGGGYNRVLANRGAKWWLVQSVKTGTVFAVVALVQRRTAGYYGTEVLTKLMDESEGPCHYGYPLAWLDRLSPAENQYSAEWREKVRAYHAAKKSAPTVQVGDRILMEEPITFRGGIVESEFVYAGKYKFYTPRMVAVRLPRDWRTRYKWSVAPAA
jgi:hypothetical protein